MPLMWTHILSYKPDLIGSSPDSFLKIKKPRYITLAEALMERATGLEPASVSLGS